MNSILPTTQVCVNGVGATSPISPRSLCATHYKVYDAIVRNSDNPDGATTFKLETLAGWLKLSTGRIKHIVSDLLSLDVVESVPSGRFARYRPVAPLPAPQEDANHFATAFTRPRYAASSECSDAPPSSFCSTGRSTNRDTNTPVSQHRSQHQHIKENSGNSVETRSTTATEPPAPVVEALPEPPAVDAAVDILTDLGMAEKDARDVLQSLKPSPADVKATVAHVRAYKREIPSLGGFVRRCLAGRWWENQAGYKPSAPQKGTSGAKPAYSEYRGEDEDRKPAKKREKAFDVALRTLQQRELEEGQPFTMRDLLKGMVNLLRSDPHRLEYHSPTSMEDTQRIGELALERLEKQGEAYLTPTELRQEMGRIYHQEQNFGGKAVAA